MKERHNKYFNSDLLIAYRGEPKDYCETKLMPSLFRNFSFVKKEKYLFELICDYEMISHDRRNIDKAIDAQHYVAISRMLDITFSAIVSIYFACELSNEDGYVYIFGFPEHYSPHSNYVEDFYSNVLNEKSNITYSKNFKVFSHSYSNERIKAQHGGFIFFPGEEFNPIDSVYYKYVKIDSSDKKDLLKEIYTLFHVDKAQLFPEKENIANIIKDKFNKNQYLDRQLSIESELDVCFNRIDYELSLMDKKQDEKEDKKVKLRKIRKEKSDLIYYLRSQRYENEKFLMGEIDKVFKAFESLI